MNKKIQIILLSAFVLAAVLGCKNKPASQESNEETNKGPDIHELQAQVETALEENKLKVARQLCQKMQEIDPGYAPTYHFLGTIKNINGNYEEAAECFEKYIELIPGQAKGYNAYGMMLFGIREYDLAIEQVLEAIEIEPGSGQSYINLGRIYARTAKYGKAGKAFNKAKQIDPDNENLAKEIKIMNEYQKYIKTLLDGVKRSPHLDIAYLGVASFYHLQGNFKDAKYYCTKAYRCRESNAKLRKDIVQLLWNLGKRDLVLDYSEKQLKIKADAGVLNTAAWIMAIDHGKLRNPPKALKYAKRASKLADHKKPKMLDTLAAAYAANGNFDKAIETIDKAIELGTGTEKKSWVREVKKRKSLYEENKPYFEKAKIIKEFK